MLDKCTKARYLWFVRRTKTDYYAMHTHSKGSPRPARPSRQTAAQRPAPAAKKAPRTTVADLYRNRIIDLGLDLSDADGCL
jgi:hypothetical protein